MNFGWSNASIVLFIVNLSYPFRNNHNLWLLHELTGNTQFLSAWLKICSKNIGSSQSILKGSSELLLSYLVSSVLCNLLLRRLDAFCMLSVLFCYNLKLCSCFTCFLVLERVVVDIKRLHVCDMLDCKGSISIKIPTGCIKRNYKKWYQRLILYHEFNCDFEWTPSLICHWKIILSTWWLYLVTCISTSNEYANTSVIPMFEVLDYAMP